LVLAFFTTGDHGSQFNSSEEKWSVLAHANTNTQIHVNIHAHTYFANPQSRFFSLS